MFVDKACRIYVYFPHGGLACRTRLASCRAGSEGNEREGPSWTGLHVSLATFTIILIMTSFTCFIRSVVLRPHV
jgi:hypothetical protein